MAFRIIYSPKEITHNHDLLYYTKHYLTAQNHSHFQAFEDEMFFIAFNIEKEEAISIPASPFGSVLRKKDGQNAIDFLQKMKESLRQLGVRKIVIKQAPSFYENQLDDTPFIDSGFEPAFVDVNHHIDLSKPWLESIHNMQERKLRSLKAAGFSFMEMKASDMETAYRFVEACRLTQGLQINISWELLQQLNSTLPGSYKCFAIVRDQKISALCICTHPTDTVAYYYLPATSPMFRSQSPMVLLIAGMVDYYKKAGFDYLDLGVSSVEGNVQKTLKTFKERMGGVESAKTTLLYNF